MHHLIENAEKKISIIIPVYGTEEYFQRCIESVRRQSYSNLEIIIVNDGSKGNIGELVHYFAGDDVRVRFLDSKENQGLFLARMRGLHAATGDYVTFLDSDDYVSSDYYHRLLAAALEIDSDIVIGKTVWENSDGKRTVYNFHESCFMFERLQGADVQKVYYGQEGNCYSWHTVWNKLYKKEIWDKALPYLETVSEHIIMTEDILFSSIVFYYAKSVTTTQNDAYFYCMNEKASTNAEKMTIQRYRKNMHDITAVFNAVERFFNSVDAPEWICRKFHETRKLYARMWRRLPEHDFRGRDLEEARRLCYAFCGEEQEYDRQEDQFFSTLQTSWNGGLEYFKDKILSGKYSCISFDIFDTLLQRPFMRPEDMFYLLDRKFESINKANVSFSKLRKKGEQLAREKMSRECPGYQDVTLTEIYDMIGQTFGLSEHVVRQMQEEEIQLEYRFCEVRQAGKELYEIARLSGRKIVIVSDMYLEKETVTELLRRNGFDCYDNLYLSSAERRLKYNGDLFKCMLRKEKLSAEEVIHIGDTWKSDIEGAGKVGIETLFFPKARDVFQNNIQGRATNDCSRLAIKASGPLQSNTVFENSVGFSCMQAIVANRYFDNPYRVFHSNSDLNGDPYFLGYYPVGMHMVGLVRWIDRVCKERGYEQVLFMSRDGWLPMKVYESLIKKQDRLRYEYLYVSRKAVLPGMIHDTQDFFDLPIEYRNHTPRTMTALLEFCCRQLAEGELEEILEKRSISPERKFTGDGEYYRFIQVFLDELYSDQKLGQSRKLAESYYKRITNASVTFDMGYSGRIQNAVSSLCGHPVNVLFVHRNLESASRMERKGHFQIETYYDYIPETSGLFREHILSDCDGGCAGFEREGEKVKPKLGEEQKPFSDQFVIRTIHQGAIDFARKFQEVFDGYEEYLDLMDTVLSVPFESYLQYGRDVDLWMFKGAQFEDSVYGGNDKIQVYDFIRQQRFREQTAFTETAVTVAPESRYDILLSMLNEKNKVVRGIIFFFMDRRLFTEKLKKNLKKLFHQ
ncbi:MAG: HAD-IA family hydrolase [Clostridiales bacterium]|nr:HAD-IA family hydrolase [Clostridiales bacterium]